MQVKGVQKISFGNRVNSFDTLNKYVVANKKGLIADLSNSFDKNLVDSFFKGGRILKVKGGKGEWKLSEFMENFYRQPTSQERQEGILLYNMGVK